MTAVHQVARALSRPRFLVALFVVLVAVMAAQCGGDPSSPAPAATTTTTTVLPVATRLCDAAAPTQIGQLQSPELEELSGLAASRQHADVLWAHNDSGDTARIFAIDLTGALRATVDVDVAKAIDWEDIAADGTTLYVADIGDNQRARTEIFVYRITEPALTATTADAQKITLHYPDGAHDAEALMVDPVGKQLVVVTKEAAGTSHVYTTPLAAPGSAPGADDALAGHRPTRHRRRHQRDGRHDRPAHLYRRLGVEPPGRRTDRDHVRPRALRRAGTARGAGRGARPAALRRPLRHLERRGRQSALAGRGRYGRSCRALTGSSESS